uniref:Neuronal acetylcholine receptor subunit alpha-7 n=1 Tax=Sinocyclocheilus rhinocerous TaxID=307959 RepID=A0A673FJ19_9TELE
MYYLGSVNKYLDLKCLEWAVQYIHVFLSVSVQGPYQRTLLKNLLKDYNRMERPVANDSQPLTVFVSMSLIQIMDVDEKNQVLTSNIWLNMHWYDHYLQWNQSEYPGVKNLRFTTDQVWTPDILLYNSADDEFDSTFKSNIIVNSSGYCNYLPPGIFMSTCNVDVRWFPFDIQKCALKFGSWTFDGWLLDLQMNEADISGYMPNGEWDLVGVPGTRNELYYDCCKEPYPDVTFVVTIRRRTLYYALNLLVPCVLLSSMTLLIFLLPADSGEKISLGITVLLSLTVFMLLVAEIMPATSDSIPLIGQYFASIMIIVGMSVIATVVVLQYHHHDPNGGNMPKWVQVVLLQWVAWFLRMKRPGESEDPDLLQTNSANNNGNLLYIGFSSLDEAMGCPSTVSGGGGGCSCSGTSGGGDPQLQAILEEVRFVADRFRGQDENDSVSEQWKFAAAVIDRLCLVAFSVFNIICTISILMAAPNFVEAVSKDFI